MRVYQEKKIGCSENTKEPCKRSKPEEVELIKFPMVKCPRNQNPPKYHYGLDTEGNPLTTSELSIIEPKSPTSRDNEQNSPAKPTKYLRCHLLSLNNYSPF